jgi:hypothetical protein
LGNLQVQATLGDLGHAVKQQVTTAVSLHAAAVPAHQAAISTHVLTHGAGEFKVDNKASLHTIASSLITNKQFLMPPFHGVINHILPSFALRLEPADLNHPHTDDLVVTAKKFEPYEQLTGISHERPEIVMLTNFLPLFTRDVSHSQPSFIHLVENGGIYPYMTDAGRYVDTHLQTRHLRYVNVVQLLRNLRLNYHHVGSFYSRRRRSFEKNIDALRDSANFLLELVRSLERLKAQLDLRDDIHRVDPHRVVNAYTLNFSRINALNTSNVLYEFIRRFFPTTYTVPDALVRLGYNSDSVRSKFSSSKIWMQLLRELKDILIFHSAEFIDIDSTAQRRDSNAIGVTRLNTPHFGLRQTLPALPALNELSQLTPVQVPQAVSVLNQTWQVLYQNVHFKTNEAHIAALANMASKEFRYSHGLAAPDVQRALVDQFSYVVTPADNIEVFDAVIGEFGNNVTDFPAVQTNSLTNVAQRQPAANVAVLTFESKYIDGDTGTLTPGGAYYVDQVLRTDGRSFDTSRLDELGDLFEKTQKSFSVVVNGMNMLATRVYDPYDRTHTQFSSIMSSPVDLVRDVVRHLVDERTGNTLPQAVNDNLGAVYSFASRNNRVKSALFLYTMAKITRSYHTTVPFFHFGTAQTQDNTPLTDSLINNVVAALETSVPQTLTGNQFIISQFFHVNKKFPTLSRDTVRASLKSGTLLTRFIESTMQQVLTAFRAGDRAMINQRTRFNGYLDTTIMMVVFDTILQMVARYNNQTIISANFGHTKYTQGVLTFNISRTTTNHRASINDLRTRLEKEVALTHKLVYTVLNTLQKMSGAFKNYSNYLKSPQAVNKLREISNIIGNADLLHMLMSEQQIMMLASTVHDLVDRISQPGVVPNNGDVDGDGDFDADDELKVLDDSVVLPRLRNAVYGLFGTDEYASQRGYNKKVLTVGIPLGFTRRLKQKVSINNLKQTTFVDKQSDIVNVVVYKVDLQNSDIVYKPKKFLFELSRFPVRNDRHFLNIPDRPSIETIVSAIPTRDFGQSQTKNTEITYWGSASTARGRTAAFSDESYAFLSQQERAQIIHNHVISYILEVYVKLLTGISLADYHFDLVEPPRTTDDEVVKLVTEHYVAHATRLFNVGRVTPTEHHAPTGGVLFSTTAARRVGFAAQLGAAGRATVQPQTSNSTGIAGSISTTAQFYALQPSPVIKTLEAQQAIGALATNLASVSHRNVPVMLHGLRTISNFSHMLTPLADPSSMSKRIMSPKQFDRVFNVVVDPDEFEIDYEKTIRTPHGKQALEQMIKKGDIIPTTENHAPGSFARYSQFARYITAAGGLQRNPTGRAFVQNRAAPNHALYRFRDRDKNQGDFAFEKYFVTVETYGEDEV